jgi:polyisoprenoid-binding protein YceI
VGTESISAPAQFWARLHHIAVGFVVEGEPHLEDCMLNRIVALVALAVATPAAAATWEVDTAHSMAGFVAKHLVFTKVHGRFNSWSGTVTLDDKDITKSKAEVKIDAKSINTENEKRDTHLKSADFFDADKYPTITFKSTKVEKAGEGQLKITGDLTIKDVTKPIVLDVQGPSAEFKDPGGNAHVAFSATGKINRKDFHLSWTGPADAGPIVSDEIVLEIEVELFHKK